MTININQHVADIAKQVIEINENYVNKSIDMIAKLKDHSVSEKITNIDQDTIVGIFNRLVKVNLECYSKLMDFGFEATNQLLSAKNETTESSFTLSGHLKPGGSLDLSFVLDNTKSENVFCQLENSSFLNSDNQQESPDIEVVFSPQSFELLPGATTKVLATCSSGKQTTPGTYYAYAKVIGFEPAYFTIVLTIEKNTRTNANQKTTIRKRTTK